MDLKQIARAIADNCRALNDGRITTDQHTVENFRLWDMVSAGEMNIIGSACADRVIKVGAYLREMQ